MNNFMKKIVKIETPEENYIAEFYGRPVSFNLKSILNLFIFNIDFVISFV
jgi:hypothetical protein